VTPHSTTTTSSSDAPCTRPAFAAPSEAPARDAFPKFVRVIEERADGLVAFEFSIGWPELAVELLLPAPAFADFCATQRVQRLGG
jgi:phenol hydroxylase P0 protein